MSGDEPPRLPNAQQIGTLRAQLSSLVRQVTDMQSHLAYLQTLLPKAGPAPAEPAALSAAHAVEAADPPAAPGQPNPLHVLRLNSADEPASIVPNGIEGTQGQPLLALSHNAARALADRTADRRPLHALHTTRAARDQIQPLGLETGVDDMNLAQSRWALVLNSADDAALVDALRPLIAWRSEQQDIRLPPLDVRPGETCGEWYGRLVPGRDTPWRARPPVLLHHPGETCSDWLRRHGVWHGTVSPWRGVPFYLLLVGRPGPLHPGDQAAIPFAFQYQLDIFWAVGRLCFTDEDGQHRLEDYTAYAEQVVAYEQRGTPRRRLALFGTRHELDTPTQQSAAELITPLAQGHNEMPGIAERTGVEQTVYLGEQATRANLTALLREPPALLLSATHGLGFAADDPRLLANQGALLCQDWSGFGTMEREHWFAGEDVPGSLEGLIVMCFACFGLGCPLTDQFALAADGSRTAGRRIAPRALIGQLPQRMLAQGALAVLGHTDRAWTHAFRGGGIPAQYQAFQEALLRLLAGKRVGFAADPFNRQQATLSSLLADELEYASFGKALPTERISALWVARNDARNYALLGDPAVHLHV